ncbi:MAG: NUDIX hydrolase [Parachlamydiales bacterium]|jgi:8-oxo-dGTP pyrophosphatase MutT (NUDIX family)
MGNRNLNVYDVEPDDFITDVISCACIIKFNNRILFLKKAPKKWSENLWGIPCGKVKVGEDIFEAVVREIKEETGFKIQSESLKYLGRLFIIQNDLIHNVHNVFSCDLSEEAPVCLSDEHSDYRWLNKNEIASYPLIPNQDKVLLKFKAFES